MTRTLALLILALSLQLSALLTGCATLAPGSDPVAVRAEQTVASAFNAFDTFLRLERQHSATVKAKAPSVHRFAEWLRAPVPEADGPAPRGIALIHSANRVRASYKANRSAENQASLTAALAALAAAVSEAQTHLATLQTLTP